MGRRPGEGDIVATRSDGTALKRYSGDEPLSSMSGSILECCLYAGTSCGKVTDIPTIAELVPGLWSDHRALTQGE